MDGSAHTDWNGILHTVLSTSELIGVQFNQRLCRNELAILSVCLSVCLGTQDAWRKNPTRPPSHLEACVWPAGQQQSMHAYRLPARLGSHWLNIIHRRVHDMSSNATVFHAIDSTQPSTPPRTCVFPSLSVWLWLWRLEVSERGRISIPRVG